MTVFLALAAGGTGGHMFPAAALAEEAKRRGWAVLLLTDARGMRYAEGFPADQIVVLDAANPNVRGVFGKIGAGITLLGGIAKARKALKAFGASAAVGFGGYPSAPGLFAAGSKKIPYAVHEQNAVLGRVNRRAAPSAAFVAHGFDKLERLPKVRGEVIHTGNPVRGAVIEAAKTPYPALGEGPIRLLIFGGSQGAALFAKVFPGALAGLPTEIKSRLEVVHQVPEAETAAAKATYEGAGIKAELAPFFSDLPKRIADSHYVIARAGASTVTELAVIGRPSLLVPLGIAMDDHQRGNAEVLVAAGAANMILEKDLTQDAARAVLSPRLADRAGLSDAAAKTRGLVPGDAAARLADRLASLLDA